MKDKKDMHILANMHRLPTEGNFCNELGKGQKLVIVTEYSIYLISWRTWKGIEKLFSHFLDLTILNNYIILSSCSSQIYHRKFCAVLVQNLLEMS